MSKILNGNLDVYGSVTVGSAISGNGYTLPISGGVEGDVITVVNGKVVFDSKLKQQLTFLSESLVSLSGSYDSFTELLDTPKPSMVVNTHEGEIVIVHKNAASQIQKLDYSGVKLDDILDSVDDLQTQINDIVEEGTTITSSSGTITVTQSGLSYNIEVAESPVQFHEDLLGLQGGISGQHYHLSASQYANMVLNSTLAQISGNLQQQIISLSGSNSYTPPIYNHNDLLGLQGGISGQHYHLSEEQYNNIISNTVIAQISGNLQQQINSINVVGTANIVVSEYPVGTFTIGLSADIGSGPDVTEKLIPIASALLPSVSGAELSSRTTAGGLMFDSVDFGSGYNVAFFNFPIIDGFIVGSNITIKLKMISDGIGSATFDMKIDDLSDGDNWTTSLGNNTYSFSHTFTSVNTVNDVDITLTSPQYHNIKPGDMVIMRLIRTGGSLINDASVISMKIAW
jgi:hypothetical protein